MKIQVLVSTINVKDKKVAIELKNKLNITTDYLMICQSDKENTEENIIFSKDKGLSKSRNLAIEKADGDICLFADDDIIYENDYKEKVEYQYIQNPDADVIIFKINDYNLERKTKGIRRNKRINIFDINRISSNQITFRRDRILEKNIKFDINFGSGSNFFLGEDTIFLRDCIKNGLKVIYVDELILNKPKNNSTWFKGFDDKYFISLGACYKRMYSNFAGLFILQFAIRKYNKYKNTTKFMDAIKFMRMGTKTYSE